MLLISKTTVLTTQQRFLGLCLICFKCGLNFHCFYLVAVAGVNLPGRRQKEELDVFWPYPDHWKECSAYFCIMWWNHTGYTVPLTVPMKVGVCEAGKSQQQNKLLRTKSHLTGTKLLSSPLPTFQKPVGETSQIPGFLVAKLN